MFKLGLDIHGVIDKNPEYFSKLSFIAKNNGCEVHILTGSLLSETIIKELKDFNIYWTHLFSMTSYHLTQGTKVTFDDRFHPWMDDIIWNGTKGFYCLNNYINVHIDDTLTYQNYFDTPFFLYDKNMLLGKMKFDLNKITPEILFNSFKESF